MTATNMQRSFLLTSLLIAGLGSVLFSAKAIVVKLCYQYGVDSATVLALRMLFSLPFFWLAVWWSSVRQPTVKISHQDKHTIVFLGFVGYYLSSYLDFLGLQYITVGLERIILYLNPTIVLLISMFFLKKKIHAQQWLALILAYASASSTFFSTLQVMILHPNTLLSQPNEVYQLSIFNAAFCTFMPMLLVMIAVNRIGSGLTAQAGMLGPIATIFLGWYFLGESITVIQVIGMSIVLVGVAILATMQAQKNQPRPELAEAE